VGNGEKKLTWQEWEREKGNSQGESMAQESGREGKNWGSRGKNGITIILEEAK